MENELKVLIFMLSIYKAWLLFINARKAELSHISQASFRLHPKGIALFKSYKLNQFNSEEYRIIKKRHSNLIQENGKFLGETRISSFIVNKIKFIPLGNQQLRLFAGYSFTYENTMLLL